MREQQPDNDPDIEQQHKEFLLAALRAASARAKTMDLDITTIGVALRGDLIGPDTAVAWIRDSNLLWLVGAIPEQVGRVAKANETTLTISAAEVTDAT